MEVPYGFNEFVDEIMNSLTNGALRVYLKILRNTFGLYKEIKPVTIAELCTMTGQSETTIKKAIKELEPKLIKVERSKGGRGHGNVYYAVTQKRGVKNTPVKNTGVIFTSLHGFEEGIQCSQGAVKNPPSGGASAPPPRCFKRKRSKEEQTEHAYLWTRFEQAYGRSLAPVGALEASKLWELIDRAKEYDGNWKDFLRNVVEWFFRIINQKPKGMECVSSQPPLPHILAGEKIWLRVMSKMPVVKAANAEISASEEYRIRRGF